MKKISTLILSAALLFGAASCSTMNVQQLMDAGLKATEAATISNDQVVAYVKQYIQYQDQQNKVLPASNAYSKRLARITKDFTSVNGEPLNFKVYQTDELNAFACADGSVRVYTGIMDVMTDDELRGVIGHEIGHVAHQDSKKAFKQALLASALREGLGATSSTVNALTSSQLGELAQTLYQAKYSRKQESQADDYSYNFLVQNGYNPWALAHAFEKMDKISQSSGRQSSALSQLFSSHPDMEARIANIEAKCKKAGIPESDASRLSGR